MVLTEFKEERHNRNLRKEGKEEGREEREDQMRALSGKMRSDGRSEEYLDAMESQDRSILDGLFEEYGLTDKGEPAIV